ncbi:LysR family transcriptional regulator [Diaphorobacter sp. HDW4A]|uniref:LysR substrate-binding domain-containing protein n=1 Tax=Diaphorobacter sp. HDW4A TaxID=2714924 RepID=UPI0014094756|nr:LysR substrate-binding domain-containing protein [Diaphorobacter sp. HDW4A]QIL80040.1 LysR family transcriptional regulator [Diaphorobacter sp. HDW4A]
MDVLRLTLRQLQIFMAVARTGSTASAAEAIALSQSATSSAINELERLLSLRLFDRTGRRLLLNDNGRALLPRAQALLEGAVDVERMGLAPEEQLQMLRIGASTTLGNHVLPRLLAEYLGDRHAKAASWHARLAVNNSAEICARVAAFELDIGLIEGPSHEPALEVNPWLRDELVLVASPLHATVQSAKGSGRPLSVDELRKAVWLVREQGSGTREASDAAVLPHLGGYQRSIELGSSEAIRSAAALGLGIASLSRFVIDDYVRDGRLIVLDSAMPHTERQCYWVVHRDKHFTPALKAFVTLLESSAKV